MNINSLRYLIELERAGSMYAAAKRALISQQALSKSIASLESELGCKLVTRTPHGTRLTEMGYTVLDSAKAIVAQSDRLEGQLLQAGASESFKDQRIRIYVSHYAAEIASMDPDYVKLLSTNTSYIEEPFNKMMLRASSSDGTDLVFTDVYGSSMPLIEADGRLAFEPIVQTRYGFVWKEGSSLEGQTLLHRSDVCSLPVVLETDRETTRLVEVLFSETPLSNVIMGTSSQLMLFQYLRLSDLDAVALCDSFRFYIMRKERPQDVEGLHFTPLSTLKSLVQVGFLLPAGVQMSIQAQHTIRVLRHYLAEHCPDYF